MFLIPLALSSLSVGEARAEEPASEPVTTTAAPVAEAPKPLAVTPRPPPPIAPPEEELAMPTLTLDRVPPRQSWDLGLQLSYGQVAYFRDTVPPWIGFGIRAGWGRNFGLNRIGASGLLTAEGDVGVHTYAALQPSLEWDFVSRGKKGGIALGAAVGPALGYVVHNETISVERSFEVAPSAAVRLGWSQGWTRVGRRMFVYAEPKVRYASDGLSTLVAVVVGSGGGR